jgi:hypothetical protein
VELIVPCLTLECMIPLVMGCKQVVFVGDHQVCMGAVGYHIPFHL